MYFFDISLWTSVEGGFHAPKLKVDLLNIRKLHDVKDTQSHSFMQFFQWINLRMNNWHVDIDQWIIKVFMGLRMLFWEWSEMIFQYEKGVTYGTRWNNMNSYKYVKGLSLVHVDDLPKLVWERKDDIPYYMILMAWIFGVNI